jgi:adenylate cyclase
MGQDESGTLARLKSHRAERLEPAISRNNGRLVKLTGDGALVEFASAVDALRAAIEFQQAVANANAERPANEQMQYRIGVHLGDLIIDDDDMFGDGVNIAARLEAEAPPGGIVISRAVREAAGGRMKAELKPLGELTLKNIERPVRAFKVEWDAADWPVETAPAPVRLDPRSAATTSVVTDKPSIAVLPFQNLSTDPEQQYFVDGLVDDIITALSRISLFLVIARTSSFIYKGRTVDVRQVGRELGVRYVLEGSVRKAGNRLRITGQLIDTQTGNHIWAERYDGALEDVFGLQDRITSSVAATIEPKIQLAEVKRAQAKATENLSAYDLYLRALEVIYAITEANCTRGLEFLERAIAIDPRFSSAYGLMANCYWYRAIQNWGSQTEAAMKGVQAAKMAVETGALDPVALARGGMGIAFLGFNPREGLMHIERALALNPNLMLAWRFGGWISWMVGDHEKSIECFEQSIRLSPMDPGAYDAYAGVAYPYYFTRRFDDAVAWLDKALGERPHYGPAIWLKPAAAAMAGRPKTEIDAAIDQLRTIEPNLSITMARRRRAIMGAEDGALADEGLRRAGVPE